MFLNPDCRMVFRRKWEGKRRYNLWNKNEIRRMERGIRERREPFLQPAPDQMTRFAAQSGSDADSGLGICGSFPFERPAPERGRGVADGPLENGRWRPTPI